MALESSSGFFLEKAVFCFLAWVESSRQAAEGGLLVSVPYQWSHCLELGNIWGFLMSLVGETHTVLLKGVSVGKTLACLKEHESRRCQKNLNILI